MYVCMYVCMYAYVCLRSTCLRLFLLFLLLHARWSGRCYDPSCFCFCFWCRCACFFCFFQLHLRFVWACPVLCASAGLLRNFFFFQKKYRVGLRARQGRDTMQFSYAYKLLRKVQLYKLRKHVAELNGSGRPRTIDD